MTFRFNSNDFTLSDAGRVLICTHAETRYFTEGKRYPIVLSDSGSHVYIIADDGDEIIQSSSTFVFSVMKPKQPKVGEVWAFRLTKVELFGTGSLFYIVKIEDGVVYHKRADLGVHMMFDTPIEEFVEEHTFVF